MQGVAGQHAVADGGVGAQARAVKGVGVVVADGLQPAHAGQDAFAAAAEACHDVMDASAEADN